MIGAEEDYHKDQIEDADGSTTLGYFADLWDPAYVMDEIYNVTYEGSSQTEALTNALQAFLVAKQNEIDYCYDEFISDPSFNCDVEAEAKNHVRSQYVLMLKCAYPDCGD